VHKRIWGVFFGSIGAQEEFFWSFKGALYMNEVYGVAKCIDLRL